MSGFEAMLYPFLDEGEPAPGDPQAVLAPEAILAEVRASTLAKAAEVVALRQALWDESAEALLRAAVLVAGACAAGGKVLAFGNGGSATDAEDLVHDLLHPPDSGWRPLPALCLDDDVGVITALGNDVGFQHVFSRQVIAYGEAGDVAVGFSTSGESANVLAAFAEARRRGLATVGFAGGDGGSMAAPGLLDAVVVAPSDHVPRIQEAHATAYHALLAMTQELLP